MSDVDDAVRRLEGLLSQHGKCGKFCALEEDSGISPANLRTVLDALAAARTDCEGLAQQFRMANDVASELERELAAEKAAHEKTRDAAGERLEEVAADYEQILVMKTTKLRAALADARELLVRWQRGDEPASGTRAFLAATEAAMRGA
jgi:sirohydrochlorin ferrochelatase